jgi:hypothetical protein
VNQRFAEGLTFRKARRQHSAISFLFLLNADG